MSEQNPRYNEIIFSKTQKQQIVNLYTNTNASTVKIGKIFNCSHKKIAKILDEFGIERKGKHRKYALNEKYFDEIDEPNKAYILGFLFADGYNSYSKGSITLSLQEDDFDILESIRKELKSENPLKFLDYSQKNDFGYHYKNQYKLSLNSIHMCEKLKNIGMIPNKSLDLKFPDISPLLYPHFIRGYFDGDGSIYINKQKHRITVTITSTKQFCEKIKDITEKELGIFCGIYDASCHNGITKVNSMSGKSAVKFLDWIYKDADLYMERKYNKYCEYILNK